MSAINNRLQRSTFSLCLIGFVLAFSSTAADAQDGTSSHRRLQLPQNSPTQPHQQLARLLQYFKTLKGEPPVSQSSGSTSSDDTLSRLKQTLGPQFSDLVDQLPPGSVNEAMKNPAIQNRVKEMLKQFSEDGKLPDFVPREIASRSPSEAQGTKAQESSNDDETSGNEGQNKSPQSPGTRFSDLIKQLRERASQTGKTKDRDDSTSTPNRSPEIPSGESQTPRRPLTDAEWQARLQELIQKQRDSIKKSPPGDSRSTSPGLKQGTGQSNPTNTPIPSELKDAIGNKPGETTQPGLLGNSNNRSIDDQDGFRDSTSKPSGPARMAPSMSEFLDQMQNAPPPDLKDLGIEMRAQGLAPKGGNKKAARNPNKMSGNLLADALKQMDPQQLRDQARKALQDKGLKNTLKDILKDAKQSARSEAVSGKSDGNIIAEVAAATGMEDTMLKALGGMTDELVEIAKDAKFGKTGRSKDNGNANPETSPARRNEPSGNETSSNESGNDKSTFQSLTESASNVMKSVADTSEAASSGSADAASDALANLNGTYLSIFLFLGLLLVVLIGSLFLGARLLPPTQTETSEQVLAGLLKQGIRCKADVIRAFHQFALKPPHETQNWWTHSRVVDSIIQQYPAQTTRIQLLSALYEQARYLPDDTEFTDAQIQEAAEAVRIVGVT